jgi:hypothetical protein
MRGKMDSISASGSISPFLRMDKLCQKIYHLVDYSSLLASGVL